MADSSDTEDEFKPRGETRKKLKAYTRTRQQPKRTKKTDRPSSSPSSQHEHSDTPSPKRKSVAKKTRQPPRKLSISSSSVNSDDDIPANVSAAAQSWRENIHSDESDAYPDEGVHADDVAIEDDVGEGEKTDGLDATTTTTGGMDSFLLPRVQFSFELTSYPKPGTRAFVNIPNGPPGRCERFFKIKRPNGAGHDCVQCVNCARWLEASKRAKHVKRQTMCQWPYEPVEGEDNLYEFVNSPFERHGSMCTKEKITWGEVAVKYVMKNALYFYQQAPNGRPFDPFNLARLSIPDIIAEKFIYALEQDWIMHVPRWEQSSGAWKVARRNFLPRFVYDDIAPIYAKTKFGRSKNSKWFGEEFVVTADKKTGYVFAMSDHSAREMIKCTHIIADGTFRAVTNVPKIKQLFVFHGRTKSGEVLPLAYFLLPSKNLAIYMRAFRDLRNKLVRVNGSDDMGALREFMADWESTLDAPAKKYFPTLRRAYCGFHYGQAVIRNVGKCGLIPAYRDADDTVRCYVHAVLGAMLMVPKYIDKFCHMMEHIPAHDDPDIQAKLKKFVDYANKQYFRRQDRREMLNAFDLEPGWPRTSNSAEGFHSGLYEALRMHGSDLRRILAILNDVEYYTHCRLEQLSAGKKPRYRNHIYVELDERIEIVKSQIVPILEDIERSGNEPLLLETIHRYARHCSRLLGGATHANLVGTDLDLVDALNDENNKMLQPALLNMNGIDVNALLAGLTDIDLVPWMNVLGDEDENDIDSD